MKREMGGGSYRGPVAATRQRRTIRFVQLLLVLISGGLMMFAGHSWGESTTQTIVLMILGGVTIGGAFLLEGGGGTVRLPTPRRLEEFARRAEDTAIERAEEIAAEQEDQEPT